MVTPTIHSSSGPAVEAASPALLISRNRKIKCTVLPNIVVALAAIIVYQGICSLFRPTLSYLSNRPAASPFVSLEPRSDVENRDLGEAIWNQITPSDQLQWHDCYSGFKCARLEVPLDYWNGTEGTTPLAISMLPAKVPITDPRYGGPILFNPGGPGVSAIMVLLSEGRTFLSQFDTPEDPSSTKGDDDARYYDVVAFDPRGINHTLPVANCFETDLQRAEWNLRTAAAGIPGSSNVSVAESWGRQRAYSLACYNFTQSSGANNIMPFITTASTARDMVTFIDRFGEWRKAEAQRMLMGRTPSHLRYQEGIERINYYGLSYGSFLGMTFASMFPERTGRFVLDGIVDTDDYIHALWTVSVLDSSKTMDVFYSMCAEAGPKTCALARNGSSAEDVRVRLQNILDRAYEHPIASTGQIPDYWTWSDVRTLLITSLYQPLMWQQFASTMAALDGASSSPLVATTADTYYPVPGKLPPVFQNIDAETGTSCGDAFPFDGDFTLQDAQAHWEHLYELGPIMAADFVALNYTCAAWPGRPKYAYRGPFGSSANSSVPPMLFIGNTADPITPIYAARKMVARFSGARLLTNDMPGHSSEAVPNACTMAHGRAYMQTGTLPPEGFVCPMNGTLFPDPESDGGGD